MKHYQSTFHPFVRPVAMACLMAGLAVGTAHAKNEDEWFDPTDWFDGNNIETDDTYNYDPYDFGYDYGFDDDNAYDYSDDWSSYDAWGADVWDDDFYDGTYWNGYSWYTGYNRIEDDGNPVLLYSIYDYTNTSRDGNLAGNSDASSSSNGQNKRQLARLSGTIEGLRNMDLKRPSGSQGEYTLARVKLENGKSTVVNLGRSSQVAQVDLKKGETVEALGRQGTVGGETVFVVHKLKADGRTFDANPAIRLTAQSMRGQRNQRTLQGEVAEIERAQSRADSPNHTLVNLTLENGREATIDLGPAASLEKIGLDEGKQVTVRGRTKKLGDREVIVADLLKIEGREVASVGSSR